MKQQCVVETNHSNAPGGFDVDHTGSHLAPQHFRSCHALLAAKMASFGRRVREMESAGGDGELVSAVCSAYYRWSTAVETERRQGRTSGVSYSGQPHDEALFDDVHVWLIDILDAALQHLYVSASDLITALSLTAVNTSTSSRPMSPVDIRALLQSVTNSLQSSHQQVIISLSFNMTRQQLLNNIR